MWISLPCRTLDTNILGCSEKLNSKGLYVDKNNNPELIIKDQPIQFFCERHLFPIKDQS